MLQHPETTAAETQRNDDRLGYSVVTCHTIRLHSPTHHQPSRQDDHRCIRLGIIAIQQSHPQQLDIAR
jgi:hypothetical protein